MPPRSEASSAYTEVTDEALSAFLAEYHLGRVLSFKGIAEGVENSNFLLITAKGPFILTLYEKRVQEGDLPFFIGLMEHLALRGVTCPQPVTGRAVARRWAGWRGGSAAMRDLSRRSCGRGGRDAAALRPRSRQLAARHAPRPAAGFALRRRERAVGRRAGGRCLPRPPRRAPNEVVAGPAPAIPASGDRRVPGAASGRADLPGGVIHADLFPDNVFFLERPSARASSISISPATTRWPTSLPSALNAWCFESWTCAVQCDEGPWRCSRAIESRRALQLDPHESVRRCPFCARGAALRFPADAAPYDWLNRAVRAALGASPKDPRSNIRPAAALSPARSAVRARSGSAS